MSSSAPDETYEEPHDKDDVPDDLSAETDASVPADDPTFEKLLDYGMTAGQKRDFPKALEALKKAAKLRPYDPDVNYNLGVLYGLAAMEDLKVDELFEDRSDELVLLESALHHYSLALSVDSTLYQACNNMATLHRLEGDVENAIEALEASLAIESDQPEIREELAELRQERPDSGE